MGIRPSFFFFYSINRELSNSKGVFSFFTTHQKGKEEELSVYYRLDFILVLVLFSGFESASCAETSNYFQSIFLIDFLYKKTDLYAGIWNNFTQSAV